MTEVRLSISHPKWDTLRGKWSLRRLIKETIQTSGGEMPLEELLEDLRKRGYMKEMIRTRLHLLDVEVVDGKARLRG